MKGFHWLIMKMNHSWTDNTVSVLLQMRVDAVLHSACAAVKQPAQFCWFSQWSCSVGLWTLSPAEDDFKSALMTNCVCPVSIFSFGGYWPSGDWSPWTLMLLFVLGFRCGSFYAQRFYIFLSELNQQCVHLSLIKRIMSPVTIKLLYNIV